LTRVPSCPVGVLRRRKSENFVEVKRLVTQIISRRSTDSFIPAPDPRIAFNRFTQRARLCLRIRTTFATTQTPHIFAKQIHGVGHHREVVPGGVVMRNLGISNFVSIETRYCADERAHMMFQARNSFGGVDHTVTAVDTFDLLLR
jgi:hypothetical protein